MISLYPSRISKWPNIGVHIKRLLRASKLILWAPICTSTSRLPRSWKMIHSITKSVKWETTTRSLKLTLCNTWPNLYGIEAMHRNRESRPQKYDSMRTYVLEYVTTSDSWTRIRMWTSRSRRSSRLMLVPMKATNTKMVPIYMFMIEGE